MSNGRLAHLRHADHPHQVGPLETLGPKVCDALYHVKLIHIHTAISAVTATVGQQCTAHGHAAAIGR